MTSFYADGRPVTEPLFANDPKFNPEWERLQKELRAVLTNAHDRTQPDPVTGCHSFYGSCRDAILSIERLMECKPTPPTKA